MMNQTMSASGGKKFSIILFAIFLFLPLVLFSQTALAAADKAIGTACTFDSTYVCQDASKAPYTDTTKWDCQAKGECIGSGTKCCKEKTAAPATPCTNCKSKCADTEETDTSKTCTDKTTPICCKTKGAAPDGATGGGGTDLLQLGTLSPIGSASLPEVVARIINTILGVVGSFALVMIIYGGMLLLTAAGKQETIKKGKDALTWAIIGVIVVMGSYVMVNFVFTAVK